VEDDSRPEGLPAGGDEAEDESEGKEGKGRRPDVDVDHGEEECGAIEGTSDLRDGQPTPQERLDVGEAGNGSEDEEGRGQAIERGGKTVSGEPELLGVLESIEAPGECDEEGCCQRDFASPGAIGQPVLNHAAKHQFLDRRGEDNCEDGEHGNLERVSPGSQQLGQRVIVDGDVEDIAKESDSGKVEQQDGRSGDKPSDHPDIGVTLEVSRI
jgi:hypothetical protein